MEQEKELTVTRSLSIIKETIERNRREVESSMGVPLLMWGMLVVVNALLVFLLWRYTSLDAKANFFWFLMPVVGVLLRVFVDKKYQTMPANFVTKVAGYIWISFGFVAILSSIVVIVAESVPVFHVIYVPITAMIIIQMCLSSCITGYVLGNKFFSWLSIISLLIGLFGVFLYPGSGEMMVLAIVSLGTLVIPGFQIINKKGAKGSKNA